MNNRGTLSIDLKGGEDQILVEFEDTGGGIEADNEEDIFEPFFTTRQEGEGSGLGLDISRQIVIKHNGEIHWKNTEHGAKFSILLPKNLPNHD